MPILPTVHWVTASKHNRLAAAQPELWRWGEIRQRRPLADMCRGQKLGSKIRRIRRMPWIQWNAKSKIYKIPRQNHLVSIHDLQDITAIQKLRIQDLQNPTAKTKAKIQDLQDPTMRQKFRIRYPQDSRSPGFQYRTKFKDQRSAGSHNKMNIHLRGVT